MYMIRYAGLVLLSSLVAVQGAFGAEMEVDGSADRVLEAPALIDGRVLPLEGGSNFRDLGGYETSDGRVVRRGVLFRSGAMTSLTSADRQYLDSVRFKVVYDLRGNDERELFPNRWAAEADLEYRYFDYGFAAMTAEGGDLLETLEQTPGVELMEQVYQRMPDFLAAQVTGLFDALLSEEVPLVLNCSAGQDRTGFSSALILYALGVPQETIVEDYLLSTQYRNTAAEKGDVDLSAMTKTNQFAQIMLRHGGESYQPEPLFSSDGRPYLLFALDELEHRYGSIDGYLEDVVGVGAEELESLRALYLE